MKIAIHHTPGSFSDRWIAYCEKQGIPYKIVNAYASDIMEQVKDCDAFMWHHNHGNYKDALFAKQLLYSLQIAGKRVFPDFNTTWHFDDKVGQKYLLEAIGAPLVPSYVFYSKREALEWAKQTSFPKVFKLRGGAGSANVRLVRTRSEAYRVIRKAFTSGFSQFNRWRHFKERFNRWRRGDDTLWGVCKGIGRLLIPTEFARMHPKEKGYVYFQDFIDRQAIPLAIVSMSQRIAKTLSLQSVAFDFIQNKVTGQWLIVEMSYGFVFDAKRMGVGYWDEQLRWHEEQFYAQDLMVECVG